MPEKNQPPPIKPDKETKSKSEKKENSSWGLLMGIVILLISLAGCILLLMFIPQKAAQISKLRSQNLTSSMSSQDILLLQEAVEATQTQREQLLAAFPDETSLLNFISLVDSLKSAEVTVAQFSVDSDTPTKIGRNPSFLPMTLVLRGKPKAVQEALLKLSKSVYFIKPITFSFASDQKGAMIEIRTSFQLFVREPYAKKK